MSFHVWRHACHRGLVRGEPSSPSATRAAAAPGTDGYRLGDPEYRRISVALFGAGLATFALLYSTQPLLPELARAFSVSAGQSALSVSLSTVGLGLALLVAGPVSEVLGRTRLIHLSLSSSAVVALLCAVAPGWSTLLVLRTLLGVTLAGLPAVAVAYLREEVHDDSSAKATGLYIGGTALGGMVGRLLAGGLADVGGWRLALGGIGLLALACALLTRWLLPASRHFVAVPARPRELLATTRRLVRDPALLALYGIGATLMGAFVAVYNAMGFRLAAEPYALSLGVAGLVFCVYPLGSLSSAYAGRLADRYGRRPVVPVACAVTAVGVLTTLARPLPVVVLGLAVLTAGFFAAHGVASGWVAARAHLGAGGTGQSASLYLFAYYLGSSVFGGLSGSAWSAGGWTPVVLLALLLVLVALALSLLLRRTASLAATAP